MRVNLNFNLNKAYVYGILGLLIITLGIVGVTALTPGQTPNPGHPISQIGPPAGCTAGQVLSFDGTDWKCITVEAGTGGVAGPVETVFKSTPLRNGKATIYCPDTANYKVVSGGIDTSAGYSSTSFGSKPNYFTKLVSRPTSTNENDAGWHCEAKVKASTDEVSTSEKDAVGNCWAICIPQ